MTYLSWKGAFKILDVKITKPGMIYAGMGKSFRDGREGDALNMMAVGLNKPEHNPCMPL